MGLLLAVSGLREMKILKRLRVTPISPVFVLGVELSMYIRLLCCVPCDVVCCGILWGSTAARLTSRLSLEAGRLPCFQRNPSECWQAEWQRTQSRQASLLRSSISPCWSFSGTTLPIEVMPKAMQKIVSFFPLTQGLTMMKNTFLGIGTGSILLPICVMVGVTALCTILAVRFFLEYKNSDRYGHCFAVLLRLSFQLQCNFYRKR